jgi:pyruvate carboxylase
VANRSEIAIRVLRAASELGIRTVAIYSHEDRFALHRFKADQSFLVGEGQEPVQAYLDIEGILKIAREVKVDAIHPGYGFLAENPEFAEAVAAAGITFIGPGPAVMRALGSKVEARHLAEQAGIAVMPASGPLPHDEAEAARLAEAVGYPVMAKASWGGGGRGMRVVEGPGELAHGVAAGRREALAAFGSDEIFLEKLVRRARHVEVQLLGDHHGNVVHLFERDCTMQRRHQKVVERAPAPYLDEDQRRALCESAVRLAKAADYRNAGTAEFLMDVDSGAIYFGGDRSRYRQGADPHRPGGGHRHAGKRGAAPGGPAPQRPCAAVPDHDRGPAEPVHSGLRPDHRLSRRQRFRHPPGRRHRLFRGADHPLL